MAFNICRRCGLWSDAPAVDLHSPAAICSHCGFRQPFRRLPLFVITGPSGAGKSSVCAALAPQMQDVVCLESDTLWGHVAATPADNYRGYWNVWLDMSIAIAQAGRPVALFGTTMPDRIEGSPQRRFLAQVQYLALVCADDPLAARLRARPAWRQSSDKVFVQDMLAYNRWLKANGPSNDPPIALLDTTDMALEATTAAIAAWIRDRLTS